MPPETVGGAAAQTRERLLGLLGPVVSAAGYDLEDVSVSVAGRRSLVRVSVDADGGIDLDAVAEVSRVVSAAIDDSDADGPGAGEFAGPYVLEVSSPGVDRPLTEQRHWRRATGRLVRVPVGEQTVVARVLDTSGSGVTLDVAGQRRDVAWAELGRGVVEIEFNRARDATAAGDNGQGG
ncbi:MAG: ribosome maturation factor RimP [Pseudonocardiales bacterium]|nr:MAG: ribosome maturation factor RimP [Pseudonocardiales bacterium]